MQKECDNYPNLNHGSCELDQYERAVVAFLESRGLAVERLCPICLPDATLSPDFKISEQNERQFLCEVKHILSSTAALPEADWRYNNREEYERLRETYQKDSVPIIALPDQIALWRQEVPYPEEGKNTKLLEEEYERKIRQALLKLPIATQPLSITVHRDDPYIWRDEETQDFISYLVENLNLIASGQTPHNWFCDFGIYSGSYRKPRDHGRFINNSVHVRREGSHLVFHSISYLDINWQKISKDCHEAQRQISYRLQREREPQNISRVVILFIEEDLIFQYISESDKLINEIRRHIQTKSPDLSAVAFCSASILSEPAKLRFIVFHVASNNTPSLSKSVFDNRVSDQIDL